MPASFIFPPRFPLAHLRADPQHVSGICCPPRCHLGFVFSVGLSVSCAQPWRAKDTPSKCTRFPGLYTLACGAEFTAIAWVCGTTPGLGDMGRPVHFPLSTITTTSTQSTARSIRSPSPSLACILRSWDDFTLTRARDRFEFNMITVSHVVMLLLCRIGLGIHLQ